jgi:hypothetical protein
MFFKPRYKFGEITKRWGDADFKKEFDGILDNWINQFSADERPLLLELLKNFYYYTEKAIDRKVVELHQRFLEINGEDISKVVFSKIPKEYGVANSDIIFTSYWLNNDIKGYSSYDVIREYLENDAVPEKLVIVDDYMGSGDTVTGALKTMLSVAPELHNSKLYVLVIHASQIGIKNLNAFISERGLDLTFICLENTDKAFQEDYIFSKIDAKLKEEEYRQICDCKNVSKGAVLGYKDIQSLVAFDKTTPNDTLGLFWHSAENFVALFRKNSQPRNTSISSLKGIARKNGHKEPVLFGIEDNQYNKFIVYCVKNGKNFSVEQACLDFGITPDMLLKRLQYIEQRGYIKFDSGVMIPSDETATKLIKRRLKGWDVAETILKSENKIPLIETSYIPPNFSKSFSGYKK